MTTFCKMSALAALLLASAWTAAAADATGKWKSDFESQIGHLNYIFDLKQEGANLTGKAVRELEGAKTEIELKEGKVTGDDVEFVEILKFDDQEIRIAYKGKRNGDEIKFTRKVAEFATMEIVAKREPASSPTPAKKVKLKVIKVDSEETAGEDGKGANAVDGNPATFWHTQWQDDSPRPPHEIILELDPPSRIKGFTYLPRQDTEVNGSIRDYEFYVSDDGKDFGAPVKKGSLSDSREKKTETFDARACRFVKLRALSEINDEAWTSAAEIDVIAE